MQFEFTIPDLCCSGCVRSITKILQTLDERIKIEIELETKKLSVETEIGKDKVVEVLEKGGYPPL